MSCYSRRKKQIFSKPLSQPLDAHAPKAQTSIVSTYATSPLGFDAHAPKEQTLIISTYATSPLGFDAHAPKVQTSIVSTYATSAKALDTKLVVPQNPQHSTAQHKL